MNKMLLLLLVLFVATNAQSQTKPETAPKVMKINIKVDSNTVKAIPVDTLGSCRVERTTKTEIEIAKNYVRPASDSSFDSTVYYINNQFREKPIRMLIITALLFFGVIGILKQFFK